MVIPDAPADIGRWKKWHYILLYVLLSIAYGIFFAVMQIHFKSDDHAYINTNCNETTNKIMLYITKHKRPNMSELSQIMIPCQEQHKEHILMCFDTNVTLSHIGIDCNVYAFDYNDTVLGHVIHVTNEDCKPDGKTNSREWIRWQCRLIYLPSVIQTL